jgi:hypothetical protein
MGKETIKIEGFKLNTAKGCSGWLNAIISQNEGRADMYLFEKKQDITQCS